MVDCNKEFQKIIDQKQFVSLNEIEQMSQAIKEFKEVLSPFLFLFIKLPHTLDEFLIEGKDGIFKKSNFKKSLLVDSQNNIKNLFKVNFSKAYQPFKIEPEIVIVEEEIKPKVLEEITNKIPLIEKKTQKSKKQSPKPKVNNIVINVHKTEPKIFQTNKTDEILEELKERGWVKDRFHGSHLIFKKDRETFTVPTNKTRLKDGTVGALNRQFAEKEMRIKESLQEKL
jgi:predicted RNA binding protein YcfA (HicA-like mRNA interferase family)